MHFFALLSCVKLLKPDIAFLNYGDTSRWNLTLRLLMSYIYIYIYGAPSKARNSNVVYIWTYVWQC